MGKVLTTIQSSSNPGKSYAIIEGNDGVVYCECWAWKKNRTCKHLDRFNASNQVWKGPKDQTAVIEIDRLAKAKEEALAILKK